MDNQSVPFVDLKRIARKVSSNVLPKWEKTLENCAFVGGQSVTELENRICSLFDVQYSKTCANGTDALYLALKALDVRHGELIALPNVTFWATCEAPMLLGMRPVLVDINSEDLQMDFSEFKTAYFEFKFKYAILPHLFGWCSSELNQYREFCNKNEIFLIEDAAQAVGVEFNGRSVFSDAVISTMSFYPAKVVGGCMDGGAVVSNNKPLIDIISSLANHGRSDHYKYSFVGINSRMGGLQADFLLEIFNYFDEILDSRAKAYLKYETELKGSPKYGKLFNLHQEPKNIKSNHYLLTLTMDPELITTVQKKLKERGVNTARTYPETLSSQLPMLDKYLKVSNLETSNIYCQSVINLPIFAYMEQAEVEYVVRTFENIMGAI